MIDAAQVQRLQQEEGSGLEPLFELARRTVLNNKSQCRSKDASPHTRPREDETTSTGDRVGPGKRKRGEIVDSGPILHPVKDTFVVRGGLLRTVRHEGSEKDRQMRVVLPPKLYAAAMREVHGWIGHGGTARTVKDLSRRCVTAASRPQSNQKVWAVPR